MRVFSRKVHDYFTQSRDARDKQVQQIDRRLRMLPRHDYAYYKSECCYKVNGLLP